MRLIFSANKFIAWFIFIFWFINSTILLCALLIRNKDRHSFPSRKTVKYAEIEKSKKQLKNVNNRIVRKPQKLSLINTQKLKTGLGAKSVVFDKNAQYLYSMNLEDMTVTEFNRVTKRKTRTLLFHPTTAKGYDYQEREWVPSFAEKPVEGFITHNGRYLWISLHNAGGVAVWDLYKDILVTKETYLPATIADHNKNTSQKISLRFFETGKTPKFITSTPDENYIFVSNWHDNTISVIDISSAAIDSWFVSKNLKTGAVPRGMAVSQNGETLYVANMGSGTVSSYDTKTFKLLQETEVGTTPRHLLVDKDFMYISLSSPEKLVKLSLDSLKPVASIQTLDDPRTITFSGDSSLIFTTCYADNQVQVFEKENLQLMGSWESTGKPVGLDVFQQDSTIEAWVCNYTGANIKVFTFQIRYQANHKKVLKDKLAITKPIF